MKNYKLPGRQEWRGKISRENIIMAQGWNNGDSLGNGKKIMIIIEYSLYYESIASRT